MRKTLRITTMTIAGLTFGLTAPVICQAQANANQGTQQQNVSAAANANPIDTKPELALASAPSPAPNSAAPASATQDPTSSAPPATPAATPAAPAPQPLPTPAMSAPLSTAVPHTFDGGPFGTLDITGILTGFGMTGNNHFPGEKSTNWDVSNAQIFLQKTTGWFQFYLQGGAYNLPDLGLPFISTNKSMSYFFGPLPVGYLKLVKGSFSAEVGALPTLIGAETTFDFEDLNIERGLLWNQENAINRGVQLNETYKKLTASVSWNDGFYSNRYTWVTGEVTYALNSANMLMFIGGGNLGQTKYTTAASPVQNNSQIYEFMYMYSHESWYVEPYWQYTNVPTNKGIGIPKGATTNGGALLFNYNFKHGISMAFRPEYITSSGSPVPTGGYPEGGGVSAVNLLYGPGSSAFAFTVTPTYQKGGFFGRADFSIVDARNITAGDAFGPSGLKKTQARGVIETGFMF